ncbi:hypothetical protein [Brunnivagina elsteri]|nr:hypothetical protein [Calothrix elsteri]
MLDSEVRYRYRDVRSHYSLLDYEVRSRFGDRYQCAIAVNK